MPGEIGHVVYAARVLTNLSGAVHDQSYWLGALFPNVRHAGALARHPLHAGNISLYSLVGANDFETGMRVHAWLDATHDAFFMPHIVRELLPWHPFAFQALQLLEDELLYPHFEDWNLVHRLLNTASEEELFYVHDRKSVQRWHGLLQQYIKEAPGEAETNELLRQTGLSKDAAKELQRVTAALRKNKRAINAIHDFWRHLEDLLR